MGFSFTMPENRKAIFKVSGSVAALIREDVWEQLLKGERIGTIEPDPRRWSLFINDKFMKAYQADNLMRVLRKVHHQYPALFNWVKGPDGKTEAWTLSDPKAEIPEALQMRAHVINGYPNLIELPAEKIKLYTDRGFTAKQCADNTRDMVRRAVGKVDSFMGVFTYMDELATGGLKREGRD